MPVARMLLDAGRGALIGTVEIIPGVSGGTVALIVGVYETLIDSAGHLARGVARAASDGVRGRGLTRAREEFAAVRWSVVLPVGFGMIAAVLAASAILAPIIEAEPVASRALFAGLILASLVVPIRMVGGRWRMREYAIAAVGAVAGFLLTSLPQVDPLEPPLPVVALAAAFAVCALVVPGVSGSFILLAVGMYAPTLAAVNERDLVYLGVFILGAMIGLGLFVSVLQWLLAHRRRVMLAMMTGLMLGSLRALWPWQEGGTVQPPGPDALPVLLLVLLGAAAVGGVLLIESAVLRRAARRLESGAAG
jgi:putative membrane protein